MLRRLSLILALVALVLPLRALAATCTLPIGTYNWTSACVVSSGAITGCSCAAGNADTWEIPEAAIATVPADGIPTDQNIALTNAAGAIVVRKGGVLIMGAGAGIGIPGGGLTVETGGTLRALGKALKVATAGVPIAAPVYTATALTGDTLVEAGNIIYCPGGATKAQDCTGIASPAGNVQSIGICYPDADAGVSAGYGKVTAAHPGETFNTERTAALAVGDVIEFWDPSGGLAPPRDVNAHYEITSLDTDATDNCMIASVRQGTTELSCDASKLSCHLLERDLKLVTLSTAYAKGATQVLVGTTAVTADHQQDARYLNCPTDIDENGTAEATRQIAAIVFVDDSATDIINIVPGGFDFNIPTASVCTIDYGWATGDPLAIYRPALLTDGNAGVASDSGIVCGEGATCEFAFTLFNHLGTMQVRNGTTVRDSWFREGGNGIGNLQINVISSEQTWTRFQMTSPNVAASHMLSVDGQSSIGPTFQDLMIRHAGDDHVLFNNCTVTSPIACIGSTNTTPRLYRARVQRARFEAMGGAGTTCSALDTNSIAGTGVSYMIDAQDLLARDDECTDTSPLIHSNSLGGGASIAVRNLVNISGRERFSYQATTADRVSISNMLDLGRISTLSGGADDPVYQLDGLSDSSIVNLSMNNGSATVMATPTRGGPNISLQRVLWLRPAMGNQNVIMFDWDDAPDGGTILAENVAVVEPTGIQTTDIFGIGGVGGDTGSIRLRNVTVARIPGFGAGNYRQNALQWDGTDAVFDTLRAASGVLVANWWMNAADTPALAITGADNDGLGGAWCMHNNDLDTTDGSTIPAANTTVIRDRREDFVDERRGNFTPLRSSPYYRLCGAVDPGVMDQWALRVIRLDPYRQALTWKTPAYGLR